MVMAVEVKSEADLANLMQRCQEEGYIGFYLVHNFAIVKQRDHPLTERDLLPVFGGCFCLLHYEGESLEMEEEETMQEDESAFHWSVVEGVDYDVEDAVVDVVEVKTCEDKAALKQRCQDENLTGFHLMGEFALVKKSAHPLTVDDLKDTDKGG